MKSLAHHGLRRGLAAGGLATAALLAFGSLAQAEEPEHGNVIRACANKQTGDLRITRGGPCGPFEHPVVWNVRGPRGPQGPAGLSGPGQSVEKAVDVPAESSGTAVVVSCPEGMVATGGGYAFGSTELNALFSRPDPATGGPVTGWRAVFSSTASLPIPALVYVVCY
ncbi:hypothetical protein [Asanoa iriomotensis]|uniref:Secreted protein n=1 Tax=Asanoa iriomotensis TaxID=234613 RepID=A0ABQ4C421_9ACTN|nr:hypothetical protein [Asanoa iriomotensis]GIF57040.1 hypothetical protein Air01nite_31350 [Asanoa iriomotensis]